MMNANEFPRTLWSIIDEARGDERQLEAILKQKPKEVIVIFDKMFRKALDNLREIPVPAMNGSEDALTDVYAHVVSMGEDFYQDVVDNPSTIPQDVKSDDPYYYGIAGRVYWELFQEELPRTFPPC